MPGQLQQPQLRSVIAAAAGLAQSQALNMQITLAASEQPSLHRAVLPRVPLSSCGNVYVQLVYVEDSGQAFFQSSSSNFSLHCILFSLADREARGGEGGYGPRAKTLPRMCSKKVQVYSSILTHVSMPSKTCK